MVAPIIAMPSFYYFNLTDGDQVIRDESGVLLSDIDTAVHYAMAAIEELRHEMPLETGDWIGWTMMIVSDTGQVISESPLAELT